MTLLRILGALLLLSVLVMIHELGHYGAGRLLGFTILEYAVGMGPKLVGFKRKGIEYNLRALPLGGMCRFYGEDEGVIDQRCFNAQKAWKRFVVIASGPLMNLVLAFLLAMVLILGWGVADDSTICVAGVTEDSPAQAAGLQAGDQFLALDGQSIGSYETLTDAVAAADQDHLEVVVLRDGQEVKLVLQNLYNEEKGANHMGVTLAYGMKKVGLLHAIRGSAAVWWRYAGLVYRSLGMLFSGEAGIKDMSGPVGIVQLLGEAQRTGWYTVLSLCTMLSVNLGLVNLLPLPALDGGRLLFILIEWVRGKPVPPEKEGMVHLVGFGLLMLMFVVITYHDILRLIRG